MTAARKRAAGKTAGGAKGSSGRLAQEKVLSPEVEELIAFVRRCVPGTGVLRRHNAAFLTGKKIFGFTRPNGLVLKLPVERIDGLLESREAERLRMGKRVLREWVLLRYGSLAEAESDRALLCEAAAFVRAGAE